MNLMCQSDIGIFTFRLYPEYGYADDDYWPDFSTLHTCRNFEDIRTWAIEPETPKLPKNRQPALSNSD